MRVLVVDDDEIDRDLLYATLARAGYDVDCASSGAQALALLCDGAHRLVICDWEMPGMTGIELCRRIRARGYSNYVYTILVTSRDGASDVIDGLNAGADDFLTKPYEPGELCVRLRAGERLLALDSRDLMIFSLAKLAESRDPVTGAHLERIREYSRVLAEDLSGRDDVPERVDGEYVGMIYLTSPLHDIGKVGVPDGVLLKAGSLTEAEREIMQTHTLIGARTLRAVVRAQPDVAFLRMAHDIALTHHERFDGNGYPLGLAGARIPLCSRIVAVADVYDALTTARAYKPAVSHDEARRILEEGSGSHFDPEIIESFLDNEEDFVRISRRFAEAERSGTGSENRDRAGVRDAVLEVALLR